MKLFLLLVTFSLLLFTTSADPTCTQQATYTQTVTPTSDTLYIDSLNPIYDNFQVEWTESLDGNVDVTVEVCSNSADEFNSLLLSLSNEGGAVRLTMDKSTPAATTTAGGESKGVYPSAGASNSPSGPLTLCTLAISSLFVFPKKRWSLVLLFLLFAIVLGSHTARADSSSSDASTTITIKAAVPTSINAFCVSGQCFYRNISGPVTQYVSLFGQRFASLDSLYGGNCDPTTVMQVPAGWSLATATPEALLAIALYNWNAYTVVLADGTAYQEGAYNNPLLYGQLVTDQDYFGAGVDGYSVQNCVARILITQSFPIPETAHEIVGTPIVSNFITFNGFDYATADNTAYSNTVAGCQTFNLYVDASSEWQIAPNEDASVILVQSQTISWGTDCLITSDGTSYMYNTNQCNATNSLSTLPYSTGTIYSVSDCNTHPSRILVRRNSTLANTWATEVPITNTVVSGGGYYAMLDNADANSATITQCQANFMSVPTNWRLTTPAELSGFITRQGWTGDWDTSYCIVTAGLSIDHNNASCAATLLTRTVDGVPYYQTSTCGRILITQNVAKQVDFTIGMKILLLTVGTNLVSDVEANLALTIFNATGASFDWVNLLDSNNNPIYTGDLPLMDSNNNPKYYAIILSDGQLSYTNPTTGVSATVLTPAQQEQLSLYKYLYDVRLVALTSYPSSTLGVGVVSTGIAATGTYAVLDTEFVAANPNLVGGIVTTTQFDISTIYYIEISYTSNATVEPLLRYSTNATQPPTSENPVGAAIITLADGTQEMHFFLGNSATFNHGPVLANVWLNWVTKGIWIGNRRVYFIPQIDDLFLETEQFDNQEIANRMTGDDLRKTRTFLDSVTAPAGSTINIEFGINGAGVYKAANSNEFQDDLYDAVRELIYEFSWESHTYTHLDFTCPEENCDLYGTTSYEAASLDLSQNIDFFVNSLFADTGGLNTTSFSRYCMITPAITGLFNGNALKAILDNGIECVVGDNSQPALIPDNLYHGIITTAEVNGYDGVFIIPRAPTEIYFDVSTPASEVIEYNSRYGIGGSLVPAATNSTLEEIFEMEGIKTARNLMLLRHDPYMFHQGNLVHFNYTRPGDIEREWSLLTLWIQSVLEHYNALLTFPLLNVKHDDLWTVYKTRMASDACGTSATITVAAGSATGVTVTSTGSCTASITGLSSCSGVATECTVEQYGPDSTVWAGMNADSVTLPLNIAW